MIKKFREFVAEANEKEKENGQPKPDHIHHHIVHMTVHQE